MKEYEINISDWIRILVGEVPAHFYVEVILKLAVLYLILMVSMRVMGKRLSAQLGRNEMAAVSSLAAAVGIPLMNPDKGILPTILVASIIITYQILIAKRAANNKKFESLTQDKLDILAQDGKLNLDVMSRTRISRERIFAQLRAGEVSHLGMVKRLYFEAGGTFSLLPAVQPKPGLSVLPEWDSDFEKDLHVLVAVEVCYHCGEEKSSGLQGSKTCRNCKQNNWVSAVLASNQ
jgi:uncharacterized membrane protein YcaP (DUF421 family)